MDYLMQESFLENKEELIEDSNILIKCDKALLEEKMFLLYSLDMSGIQNFIYSVQSSGAIRALRTRSLYLELMMEDMVDSLLVSCGVSRANLLYCGGGHCYILLANTKKVKMTIEAFETETNRWLFDMFRTELYVASGYAMCSANDLNNVPEGSYKALFQEISNNISAKKLNRYTAEQLIRINTELGTDSEGECAVCGRIDWLKENGKCKLCNVIERFSPLLQTRSYFVIDRKGKNKTLREHEIYLPLPGGRYLRAINEAEMEEAVNNNSYLRSYSKNDAQSRNYYTTKIWVSDYQNAENFEKMVESSKFRRLAVLRADVDNLGQAFVQGFENQSDGSNCNTLLRTITFSRTIALFFKYHINEFLEQGEYRLYGGRCEKNAKLL